MTGSSANQAQITCLVSTCGGEPYAVARVSPAAATADALSRSGKVVE